jgi:hypothetical protein
LACFIVNSQWSGGESMQVPGVIGSVGHQQHRPNSNQMTRGHGVVNSIGGLGVGSNWLESSSWQSGGGEASNKGRVSSQESR